MEGVGDLNIDLKHENEDSQEVHNQVLSFLKQMDTLQESGWSRQFQPITGNKPRATQVNYTLLNIPKVWGMVQITW